MKQYQILFWAFIFPVYTVPTIFIFMTSVLDAWPLVLWGGAATAIGLWAKETERS